MIKNGLRVFHDKRVLLLQGPVGPFFRRLAADLRREGAQVFKVNFNGGDVLFYPANAVCFRDREEAWPDFFEELLKRWKIEVVFLFGDCRMFHRQAREIAQARGLEIGVFEEGYVRPDYISFERLGANANSLLPKDPAFYLKAPGKREALPLQVGGVFYYAMAWAMLYNLASHLAIPWFRHYSPHRTLKIWVGIGWLRSFWRKFIYAQVERGVQERLEGELSGRYYLVPLQLHNDAQITVHSDYNSVEDFIHEVIESFSTHAPADATLVLKQHPFDRGFQDYAPMIEALVREKGLESRVLYIHDLHLPTLLRHARGVVLINSTVGFSALVHGAPLKACGKAIYDIPGLTFQGSLDDFWTKGAKPSPSLYVKFRSYVIEHTQINGNFYKRLPILRSRAGIYWSSTRRQRVRS